MSHPLLIPIRIGACRLELPAEALAGQHVRIRLPQAPILRIEDDGSRTVVGNSGTEWAEHLVRPLGSCAPDPDLEPDLFDSTDGQPHQGTICPECLDSWACDWQIELLLAVEGSGEY